MEFQQRPISSSHNPRFRAVLALQNGRQRRQSGRILIDGIREIGRAIDSGVHPDEAWVDPERLDDTAIAAVVERLRTAGCPVIEADGRLVGRLGYGQRDTGVVLVARTPDVRLDRLSLPADPLVVILEGVEKPGNLGAVVRTADAAGVTAVVLADGGTDPFNPNAIRASLGTVFVVPLAVASSGEALEWVHQQSLRIVAAHVDGDVDHTAADLTGRLAIVLGSEVGGLSAAWASGDVTTVRVPMLGVGDSLNVSATAAVLSYEAVRQRRASQ